MIFTYRSVIASLQEMLNRPGFFERCETWRSLPQQSGLYNDVYDGKIWDEFKNPNGIPFLSIANNFAFQLNVDWLTPSLILSIQKVPYI